LDIHQQIEMAENVVATYYYPTAAPAAMEVCGAELGKGASDKCFDDDGRPKRNGKVSFHLNRHEDGDDGLLGVSTCRSCARCVHADVRLTGCVLQGRCGRRARTSSRR
jgi:hypothetical protein